MVKVLLLEHWDNLVFICNLNGVETYLNIIPWYKVRNKYEYQTLSNPWISVTVLQISNNFCKVLLNDHLGLSANVKRCLQLFIFFSNDLGLVSKTSKKKKRSLDISRSEPFILFKFVAIYSPRRCPPSWKKTERAERM